MVGTSLYGEVNESDAWRWTGTGAMVLLGHVPETINRNSASGVSGDGSVVVGRSISHSEWEAFRWTVEAGIVGLGDLPGGSFQSNAFAVCVDGSAVVGYGSTGSGLEAFRWTQTGGMVGLGTLPGYDSSSAYAVSADGSVVVGRSRRADGSGAETEAFRWTAEGGMVGLGHLGDIVDSYASDVSADGSVVVGRNGNGAGLVATRVTEAFLWTESQGMLGLGYLPGGGWSAAFGVSADGSVVVGSSGSASGDYEAVIWDAAHGIRSLKDVLTNDYGLDLTGWTLERAHDISADGRVIVGWANDAPFVAVIPEPSSIVLAVIGLLGLLAYLWRGFWDCRRNVI